MKSVQLISYQYPNTLHVSIKGKLYTYLISEHWARKVMKQLEYGEGWRAVGWLKVNGKLVNGGDER